MLSVFKFLQKKDGAECAVFRFQQGKPKSLVEDELESLVGFAIDVSLDAVVVLPEACSARDDVSHDHVLFKAEQVVGLTCACSIGKNTCCVLEGGCRNKGLGPERCFGDPKKNGCCLRRSCRLLRSPLLFWLWKFFLIDIFAIEEGGIAWIGDAHFLEHLTHDDLNVLIVDVHTLQTINFLHLVHEILLKFANTANLQDLVRNDKAIGELLPLTTWSPR